MDLGLMGHMEFLTLAVWEVVAQQAWEDQAEYTCHPTLGTLHSSPCTLSPTPYTPHPTPYTPHPTLDTLRSSPYTLHPTPYTPHPTPYTRHPELSISEDGRVVGATARSSCSSLLLSSLELSDTKVYEP